MRAINTSDLGVLSALLDEALDLDPDARARWLADLPQSLAGYRQTVAEMLAQYALGPASGAVSTIPRLADEPGGERPWNDGSRTVGPYRALREIGRGGMGSVWLAERIDGLLKRQVALKLPHSGIGAAELGARLARERDILAALEHPHIARLYDAGVTADGQAFLALAYVDGLPLLDDCDARTLGLRARVTLFLQVLDAVQFAHARLVIHRDLKPSNIMVDGQGQVQLLDFGIAKLLVDGQADATELTVEVGQRLTPEYASPEQIAGAPVTTASDVYSLGVLLYELLVGTRPYTLASSTHASLNDAILAAEPVRPSTAAKSERVAAARATNPVALAKTLRGDLESILLKALQKPVGMRYPTAEAFRQDLQRYLDGEPVLAQPYSALRSMRKYAARHRTQAALAGVALVAILGGTALAGWQARVATQERDNAVRLLARNEAIREFLDMLITDAAESVKPLTVSEMLARSQRLADDAFKAMPEQLAVVMGILGTHYFNRGDVKQGEALMSRSLEAVADTKDASFKARFVCQRAVMRLMSDGKVEPVQAELTRELARELEPGVAAECYDALAAVAIFGNRGAEAVEHARKGLERLKGSARDSLLIEAALTQTLGNALAFAGRIDEAVREFERSMAIYTRLGREGNGSAIVLRTNWGSMIGNAGDAKGALKIYDDTLAELAKRGTTARLPPLLAYRARVLALVGRRQAARDAYVDALAHARNLGDRATEIFAMQGLAVVAMEEGRADDVESMIGQVNAMSGKAGGLAGQALHLMRGRLAQARGQWKQAHSEYTQAVGARASTANTAYALIRRSEVSLLMGLPAEALADAQAARAITKIVQGGLPYSAHTGTAALMEARALAASGQPATARRTLETSVGHLSRTVDDSHHLLVQARALLHDLQSSVQ